MRLQWHFCTAHQRTTADEFIGNNNITQENRIKDGVQLDVENFKAKFLIEIPKTGYFERRLEFRTQMMDTQTNTLKVQLDVKYKHSFFD